MFTKERITSKNNKNKLSTRALTAVGAASLTLLAACSGGGESAKSMPKENDAYISIELPGDKNHDNVLSKYELSEMTPEQVAMVDPSQLVVAYGPDFDAWRKDTLKILIKRDKLTPDQAAVIGTPDSLPTGPKDLYSDQDVMNQVTLDIADASIQEDNTEGLRMLPLPYSPEATGFEKARRFAATEGVVVLEPSRQVGESLPHPTGKFNGVDLTKYADARIIKQELLPNEGWDDRRTVQYGLYGLVKNGNDESWQLLRSYKDDAHMQMAILNLIDPRG